MLNLPKSFDKKWFEFEPEVKRRYADQTWVPLRMSRNRQTGSSATKPPYNSECWAVGTVAFPPENMSTAEEMHWSELGTGNDRSSYAYRDGHYKRSDEFQHYDKETVGTNLVLVQRGTRTRKEVWHINQDLIMALDLVKEGNNWVSPSQDFDVVIKEEFSEDGSFSAIEIKKAIS